MEEKRHYKLYKSGKNWVVASIAAITVLSGSGLASTALNVHADTAPVATAKSNINFAGLKAQLNWSNQKVAGASIYTSANGMKLVAQLKSDIAIANGYIANPNSTTQAKVTAITTALRNDGIALNNEVANILNGQLFWSNKKVASDYVTAQGKALFAQFQTALATAKSYVANPSLATPANVVAISAKLHQLGLDLYASKVTDLKAQLVWSNAKKAADYTTDAGKKAFTQLTADIEIANGYVAQPEFATPAQIQTITDKLHQDGLDLIASQATVSFDQLNKDITAFSALKAADYTAESFAPFQTALTAAQKVAADKTSTQAVIDAADKALTAAQGKLVKATVATDLSALQGAIAAAPSALKNSNGYNLYTATSFATYLPVLQAAKAVAADKTSTQDAVDTATANLQAAIKTLASIDQSSTSVPDDSQLATDVNSAVATQLLSNNNANGTYTAASYQALVNALAGAKALYTSGAITSGTTQTAIDNADAKVKAAAKALTPATVGQVDKSLLQQAINNVKSNIDANGNHISTAASYQPILTALNAATKVLNDPKATKDQVTAQVTAVNNAVTNTKLTPATAGQVDDSQLQTDLTSDAVTKPSNLDTWASLQAVVKAFAKAQALYTTDKDGNATTTLKEGVKQADVDGADLSLQAAIASLTTIDGIDLSQLQNLVTSNLALLSLNNIKPNGDHNKQALLVSNLQAAFKTATNILNGTTKADQSEVNGAVSALQGAISAVTGTNGNVDAETTDVTLLNNVLSNVPTNNTTDNVTPYTSDSYKAVNDAVTAAKKLLTTDSTPAALDTTTQVMVDQAITAITNAENGLVSDHTQLNADIARAMQVSNLNADGSHKYTANSFALLTKAISDAQKLAANADQATVNAADKAITDVKLVAQSSTGNDFTGVQAAITDATSAYNNGVNGSASQHTYTTTSFAAFTAAYTAAGKAATTKGITQTTIDQLAAALVTAKAALVSVATGATDSSQLATLIASSSALQASDYTRYSFGKLVSALQTAQALSSTSTQAQIDAAYKALNDANTGLVSVNKAGLQADILLGQSYTGNYTLASWVALQNALQTANGVLNNATATADQIASADSALATAIAGMVSL